MTEMQQTAWLDPCYDAEDCADQKYRSLEHYPFSVMLTLNVGLE